MEDSLSGRIRPLIYGMSRPHYRLAFNMGGVAMIAMFDTHLVCTRPAVILHNQVAVRLPPDTSPRTHHDSNGCSASGFDHLQQSTAEKSFYAGLVYDECTRHPMIRSYPKIPWLSVHEYYCSKSVTPKTMPSLGKYASVVRMGMICATERCSLNIADSVHTPLCDLGYLFDRDYTRPTMLLAIASRERNDLSPREILR